MFKKGEIVKLKNNDGKDFDVRIVNSFEDEGKGYYTVEPLGFESFNREVPCEQCYKEEVERKSMNIHEAIKKILEMEHMTQVELAGKLGYKTIAGLNNALTRNATIGKVVTICDALDYEVQLVPRNGTEKKERTVVVNGATKK